MPHPELAVKLGSVMEIQIMLIEMKFYSANVYFTLLSSEVQSGLRELTISYSYVKRCGLGCFKSAT